MCRFILVSWPWLTWLERITLVPFWVWSANATFFWIALDRLFTSCLFKRRPFLAGIVKPLFSFWSSRVASSPTFLLFAYLLQQLDMYWTCVAIAVSQSYLLTKLFNRFFILLIAFKNWKLLLIKLLAAVLNGILNFQRATGNNTWVCWLCVISRWISALLVAVVTNWLDRSYKELSRIITSFLPESYGWQSHSWSRIAWRFDRVPTIKAKGNDYGWNKGIIKARFWTSSF